MIDLHSHVLPGIDDGAKTFDDSLVLLKELADFGMTDVVATPHYVDETTYISSSAENAGLLKELQKKLDENKIAVRVHLGNEIYITPRILKLIKDGEISTLGGSKYLLVELPMSGEFPSYEDIILELIRDGYKVILAHPERYNSFQKDFSLVQELFDMGVIFQCNLGSFAGQYGGTVKKLAVKLAKADMIFALGSDIHHPKGIKFWNKALKKVSKYYDEIELDEILITNPRKILAA